MEDGGKLIVEAGNAGPNNICVRAMNINGKPWNQAWFTHDLIANGGKLTFEMSDQPTDWARAAPVPPSYRFTPVYSASIEPLSKEDGDVPKTALAQQMPDPIFCIGKPDGSAMEFALANKGAGCESAYSNAFPKPVAVTVGPGDASSWPFIHPSSMDVWAGATTHVYTIRFSAKAPVPRKLKLVLGLISAWQQSNLEVTINGTKGEALRLPGHNNRGGQIAPTGETLAFDVPLPDGSVKPGDNTLTIGLSGGSWIVYDYVLLTERQPASVTVDLQRTLHKMAGGMGASWHSIRKVLPGPRGSAYGANPPLENAKAWAQIDRHARWLGLDWMRVEFDQCMYAPERNRFDWDNEEMRTLYRVLDWCETNRVDVFLTQMWTDVEWNKLPNRDALTSAPRSVEDFAEGMSTLTDHLLNKKKYTCIRWLCIANEPQSNWWLGGCSILDGLKAVRKALDAKGIALPLSGPDSVNGVPYNGLPPDGEFDNYVGAYDTHTYNDVKDRHELLAKWAECAHARKKPFFLSEFGICQPWGDRPKSYEAFLIGAETVLGGLAVGVDGFNRWSFLNRGDIDGQWQLVRTWDIGKKAYLADAVPEPVPYMGYAMFTRFTSKHSEILDCKAPGAGRERTLWAAALRSPAGSLTILVLNLGRTECETTLVLDGLKAPLTLYFYSLSEPTLAAADFALGPGTPIELAPQSPRATMTIPARGMMTLTTFHLQPADPGIIEHEVRMP